MEEGRVILSTSEYQDLVQRANNIGYVLERFERVIMDNDNMHRRLSEIEHKLYELVNSKK